eukprot:144261-Rhodomonas_salina.1
MITLHVPGTWVPRYPVRVPGIVMGQTAARGYPPEYTGNLGNWVHPSTGVLLESPVWGTLVVGTRVPGQP